MQSKTAQEQQQHLWDIGTQALVKDVPSYKVHLQENYRKIRKEMILGLKEHPSEFAIYKVFEEAKFEANIAFRKEFKLPRYRKIVKDAIKEEKQLIWENSREYQIKLYIKKLMEDEEAEKNKAKQAQISEKEPTISIQDPLSGLTNLTSLNSQDPKQAEIKMTSSELVDSENKDKDKEISLAQSDIITSKDIKRDEALLGGPAAGAFLFTDSLLKDSMFNSSKVGSPPESKQETEKPKITSHPFKVPSKEPEQKNNITSLFSSPLIVAAKSNSLFGSANVGNVLGSGTVINGTLNKVEPKGHSSNIFNQAPSTMFNASNKNESIFGLSDQFQKSSAGQTKTDNPSALPLSFSTTSNLFGSKPK